MARRPHGWHFNFRWKGVNHRLSLDRECGRHIESKTERLKSRSNGFAIPSAREGTYSSPNRPARLDELTFSQFAKVWEKRRGKELVRSKDNRYRLEKIEAFVLLGTDPPMTLGEKLLAAITTDDIEAFHDARNAEGWSAVTVNHGLKLLRKMFRWGVRKGYLKTTPFKRNTEPVIQLEREIPRARRLQSDDEEKGLLAAANPHLRGIIIALLDTACRPGEILSLQWKDVNLERKELTIQAVKSKTSTSRIIPVSSRLMGILEMRRIDPADKPHGPEAYVFGDFLERRIKSGREAWHRAREQAGLGDLQLRDLRHEAGSRFAEAGMPINYVSGLLDHTNLTTTGRYLNINHWELHRAMQRYEETRQADSEKQSSEKESGQSKAEFAQTSGPRTSRCATV